MTYDPDLIDRLVMEAREDDARMTDAPWIGGADAVFIDNAPILESCTEMDHEANCLGIARTRNNLAAMADQLEAARREIERLVEVHAHAAGVIIDEQLLMRPVVEAAEIVCGPDLIGTERMDLVFDTLMPAIDAYRAAKGNRP